MDKVKVLEDNVISSQEIEHEVSYNSEQKVKYTHEFHEGRCELLMRDSFNRVMSKHTFLYKSELGIYKPEDIVKYSWINNHCRYTVFLEEDHGCQGEGTRLMQACKNALSTRRI